MKKIILSAAVIGLVLTGFSCKENKATEVLTKEVTFKKEGSLVLKKAANDSIIANLDIEFAEGDYEIQTGLMYRKSMLDSRGMLFIFESARPRAFYMKNTDFGLDIIFLDAEQKVINIHKNAVAGDQTSLPSNAPAQYVLEVNAGLSEQWNLETGDSMEFTRN